MRTSAWITAALLLVLTACASEPQEVAQSSEAPAATAASEAEASPSATATTPAASPSASAAPATEPPASEDPPTESGDATVAGRTVELWFLRDRGTLTVEPELHRIPADTQAVARATLDLLVATAPRDPALDSVIPAGTTVRGVSLNDGDLMVDLHFPGDTNLGAAYEGMLYEQIRHTGAQFSAVRRVGVLVDGKPPASGHYANLDRPRRPSEDNVSPVVVLDPQHRDVVAPGGVTVRGTANVYEATVVLRLVNPSGKTVRRTFTTATCGTGCRGVWEHTFRKVHTAGAWTVVAAASDPSDGEGDPPYTTKRRFVIR